MQIWWQLWLVVRYLNWSQESSLLTVLKLSILNTLHIGQQIQIWFLNQDLSAANRSFVLVQIGLDGLKKTCNLNVVGQVKDISIFSSYEIFLMLHYVFNLVKILIFSHLYTLKTIPHICIATIGFRFPTFSIGFFIKITIIVFAKFLSIRLCQKYSINQI